jgi:flagellar protein FlgJ
MATTPITPQSLPPAAATAANNYSDINALSALKANPSSPQAIHAVAQQVEALFLQMMLKSMRDASAELGEGDSNEMGMYQDMFDKQISLSLSQRQDLGLSALLARQLSNAAAADGGGRTAATPAGSAAAGGAAGAAAEDMAQSPGDFVKLVLPAINSAAQALGVSPLGVLAQAALETGWGKRMARNPDGSPSLNLFGIKADDGWDGARVAADSVEYSGGVATPRRAAFRAYGSVAESVGDFAQLLQNSPRYREVVANGANAQAYVEQIGKSGYATDPQYGNKLNNLLHSSTFRAAVLSSTLAL